MRKFLTVLSVLSGLALVATPARADFAFGAGLGTLGAGIHASKEVNSFVALRANANWAEFSLPNFGLLSSSFGGISYDMDVHLKTYGLLVDFHPLGVSPVGDGLVLTGGVYYNKNEFDFTTTASVPIGGSGTLSGTLLSEMTFDKKYAPYVGFGYDGTFHTVLPVSFYFTGGVLFQGSPTVNMTLVSGTCTGCNIPQAEQDMQNDASNYKYYPVIAMGLSIRF